MSQKTTSQRHRRPKWAKQLTAKEWLHLKEGQCKKVPTLQALRSDAATCPECKAILEKLEEPQMGGVK